MGGVQALRVSVTQSINCAHRLPGTELHGHTYWITAIYSGDLDVDGMVIPIKTLADDLQSVLAGLDHLQLENVIGEPATAERLAMHIQEAMSFQAKIRVQVGDDGWVETD